MELSGLAADGQAEGRLGETVDGNGTGRRDVELERRLAGEKERVAGGGDAGEHGVGIHVHALDDVGNGAAPTDMLSAAADWRRWPATPRSDRSARRANPGSGTELALICALVAGAISVPVLATMAARPALKRFCTPPREGLSAKVRPLCGVLRVMGSRFAERISETRRAGARLREGRERSWVGGDHGAVAIVAALQVDADERVVVGGAGSLRHGGERVELEEKRARGDAGHGGHGSGSEETAGGY